MGGFSLQARGHVEKSQSEMESSKAAGKVKRAVELREAFLLCVFGTQEAGRRQSYEAEGEEAVGGIDFSFLLCCFFHIFSSILKKYVN